MKPRHDSGSSSIVSALFRYDLENEGTNEIKGKC